MQRAWGLNMLCSHVIQIENETVLYERTVAQLYDKKEHSKKRREEKSNVCAENERENGSRNY